MHTTKSRVGVALLALIALSACSGEGAGAPTDIEPKQITSAEQLDIPLRAYELSEQDARLINTASRLWTERCAAKYGVPSSMPASLDEASTASYDGLYGLIDREQAQKYGYKLPDAAQDAGPVWTPTPLEMEVMTGVTADGTPSKLTASDGSALPAGGCGQEAVDQLFPQKELFSVDVVYEVTTEAFDRTRADQRAVAAQQAWSQCMQQAGYAFETRSDAGLAGADSTSIQEEVRQAVADVDCAISTNYVGIWNAVDAAYQRQLIAEREADLQAVADAYRAAVQKAGEIVQGGQG